MIDLMSISSNPTFEIGIRSHLSGVADLVTDHQVERLFFENRLDGIF